jgi:hypothetical protein
MRFIHYRAEGLKMALTVNQGAETVAKTISDAVATMEGLNKDLADGKIDIGKYLGAYTKAAAIVEGGKKLAQLLESAGKMA